jgi:hypothetical protein
MRNGTNHCGAALLLVAMAALGLGPAVCDGADPEKSDDKAEKATTSRAEAKTPYLGILIEDLHPALASHLPGLAATGQGVLVQTVTPDSPAAKAGVKNHDILLTYDDQKLYNHEQLLKLISNDQVGREVNLGLVRQGKQETIKIQLGERPAAWNAQQIVEDWLTRHPHRSGLRRAPLRLLSDNARAAWDRIDSISIKRLDEGRFRAVLTHFDKHGKLEKHEYEGTREELRKLIDADDDLKRNERYHLLRSLDMSDRGNPWELLPDENDSSF